MSGSVAQQNEQHRILLVDDDVDGRERLLDLLSDAGYGVDVAQDGAQAMQALASGTAPSLILLDLDVEGRRFCNELKQAGAKEARLKKIPVVVLSAQGDIESAGEVVHAHAMLPKPLEADRVLATVRAACS